MNINIHQVPKGEHGAGSWTFSVDDEPSHFYSSRQAGVVRKIASLTGMRKQGTVKLPTMGTKTKTQGSKEQSKPRQPDPMSDLLAWVRERNERVKETREANAKELKERRKSKK